MQAWCTLSVANEALLGQNTIKYTQNNAKQSETGGELGVITLLFIM